MFTGIVESLGTVVAIDRGVESVRLSIRDDLLRDTARGDSVAVNGVCLTAAEIAGDVVTADVMLETLQRTSLGGLSVGATVNLERAATMASRLGGHLVQGHVDGTATITHREPQEHWEVVRISLPPGLARYVVHKGSIAVDGVSLTVSGISDRWFEVSLIPETLKRTTLGAKQPGETVNLEVDVIAKYVEKLTGCAR